MLLLHVDDMLVASSDLNKLEEIKGKLSEVFEVSDLGEPKSFLGMTIERDRKKSRMKIHQESYIEKILIRINMHESTKYDTPMVTSQVASQNKKSKIQSSQNSGTNKLPKIPHHEAVGNLLNAAGTPPGHNLCCQSSINATVRTYT